MIHDRALERLLPERTVALTGDLIRAAAWMGVVLGWAALAMVYSRFFRLLFAGHPSDFTIFYYTARMIADGRPMYGDVPPEYGLEWEASHLANLNLPHFHLLFVPLVPLGYQGALAAWGALGLLALGASLWLIVRELGIRLTPRRVLAGGLALFGSAPLAEVFAAGESSLLLMLPFTCAWIALRRAQWTRAGAWLGVCASFKLFLLFFPLWLAINRRWSAVLASAAAVMGIVACGTVAFGAESYAEWARSLDRIFWWWHPMNASLRGLASRLFAPPAGFEPVYDAPALVLPVWTVAAAAVAGTTLWRLRRAAAADRADASVVAVLAAALLLSPLGWVYYLPLVIGPLLGWLAGSRSGWTSATVVLLAVAACAFYIPVNATEGLQPSGLATLALASAYTWGALALWGAGLKAAGLPVSRR